MADVVAALVAIARADAGVAALAAARVFGGELPAGEAQSMPRAALVIKASGGATLTDGSYAQADAQRVDLFAYGQSRAEADRLLIAAAQALRGVRRRVAAGVLVHWARPAGGYASGRDADLAWPRAWQSFQVFHSLQEV